MKPRTASAHVHEEDARHYEHDDGGDPSQINSQTFVFGSPAPADGALYSHGRLLDAAKRPVRLTHGSHHAQLYTHDALGRRQSVTPVSAATLHATSATAPGWAWTYNDKSEVTGAARFNQAGVVASQARGYDYDEIGNRESATRGLVALSRTSGYTANALNQYSEVSAPREIELTGQAAVGAEIWVSINNGAEVQVDRSQPENQTGEPNSFRHEVTVSGTGAQMVKARVRVVLGTASQERTVWLYAPPAAEVLVHDEDGNKIEDGRWKYEWDAENRLVAQEERGEEDFSRPAGAPARKRLSFAYDYMGRRIAKTVHEWEAGTGSFSRLVKDLRYVYDGWNMVAELDHTTTVSTGLGGSAVVRTYVWGPDIAGQRSPGAGMPGFQEAGGVGGLLGVNHQGTTYFPLMDGNGSILGLHAGNGPQEGMLVARYDYDPFGNRITNTGPGVEPCPFGFSTKYTDSETGFVYFGHRSYEPPTGRWPNRDPIGERGGLNLYGMVGNDAVNKWDYLGQWEGSGGGPDGPPTFTDNPGWAQSGPGVAWQAEPCKPLELLQRKYIQYMVGYAPWGREQPPQFDGATPQSPFYPNLEPNEPFQDTPKGWNGSPKFEVCRACVCKANGKIMAVGPCIKWDESNMWKSTDGSTTNLDTQPASQQSQSPSADFMRLLRRDYGSMLGSDESDCPCKK